MGTILNYAMETRKKYECAKEEYNKFCMIKWRLDGSPIAYFESGKKDTLTAIYGAKSSVKNMLLKGLEKDSCKRNEYEAMLEELEKMSQEIETIVFG